MEPNLSTAVVTVAGATTTAAISSSFYDYNTLVFAGSLAGALLFTFLNQHYKLLLKLPLAIISFGIGFFMTPGVQVWMINRGYIRDDNHAIGFFIALVLSSSVVAVYGYIQRRGIKGVAKDVQDIRKGKEVDDE
ncbi:hypothetical protein [Thorsellia anophelis]|uniref:Phage holin n=1 Tax=Thorsellia anophelis DSM 18579 TaxID=1123402 RepID=A0A1I0D9S0_9GAMM|nr:hypothetical protein [Thorsellia anophelis]SET28717.1 Putative phage holin [Thorsellia anophelis DSM 18579]